MDFNSHVKSCTALSASHVDSSRRNGHKIWILTEDDACQREKKPETLLSLVLRAALSKCQSKKNNSAFASDDRALLFYAGERRHKINIYVIRRKMWCDDNYLRHTASPSLHPSQLPVCVPPLGPALYSTINLFAMRICVSNYSTLFTVALRLWLDRVLGSRHPSRLLHASHCLCLGKCLDGDLSISSSAG